MSRGVKILESECFELCTNLIYIKLPVTLRHIHFRVFNKCRNLEKVILPKKLLSCQPNAFWGCTSLKTITTKSERVHLSLYQSVQDCKAEVILKLPKTTKATRLMKQYLEAKPLK